VLGDQLRELADVAGREPIRLVPFVGAGDSDEPHPLEHLARALLGGHVTPWRDRIADLDERFGELLRGAGPQWFRVAAGKMRTGDIDCALDRFVDDHVAVLDADVDLTACEFAIDAVHREARASHDAAARVLSGVEDDVPDLVRGSLHELRGVLDARVDRDRPGCAITDRQRAVTLDEMRIPNHRDRDLTVELAGVVPVGIALGHPGWIEANLEAERRQAPAPVMYSGSGAASSTITSWMYGTGGSSPPVQPATTSAQSATSRIIGGSPRMT
jgi:hypothetical protein